MSDLPAFIPWIGHGAASLAPPGVFTGTTAHAFVFRSDRAAMQALADRFLNAVTGGRPRYEAPVGRALASFIDVQQCTSSVDCIGWMPGRECALWVPLLEWGSGLLPRPVLWAPYICIDYTIGELTGREVWGWSKVWARINVPDPGAAGVPRFTCNTTMFPVLAPETRGVFGPLFQVSGREGAAREPASAGPAEALAHFLGGLYEVEGGGAFGFEPRLAAVALKQFRDVRDPGLACYRAICESPVQVTRFGGFGLLTAADWKLEITTCESHQIVTDFLGRTPDAGQTVLPVELALWAEVDFQALPGRVIAS